MRSLEPKSSPRFVGDSNKSVMVRVSSGEPGNVARAVKEATEAREWVLESGTFHQVSRSAPWAHPSMGANSHRPVVRLHESLVQNEPSLH